MYWTAQSCCRSFLVWLLLNLQTHTYSLPRQLSEAGLEERLRQAEDAVNTAQATFDTANDKREELCGQLLLARQNALAQLREEKLLQLRAATGDIHTVFLRMTCRSSKCHNLFAVCITLHAAHHIITSLQVVHFFRSASYPSLWFENPCGLLCIPSLPAS